MDMIDDEIFKYVDGERFAQNNTMMIFRRLVNYVGAEPFRPFRIKMTSGETFEIRHPEMIQIGRTTATVYTWMDENNDDPKEREREISLMLVESVEPIDASAEANQDTE